ncbi:MAG: hypothetical protein MJY70_05975 [Bacteroidales bacterium]|nr:hypothetical protein [Bacteroidales bacterium]
MNSPSLELGGGGVWLSNVTDAADLGKILGKKTAEAVAAKDEQISSTRVSIL